MKRPRPRRRVTPPPPTRPRARWQRTITWPFIVTNDSDLTMPVGLQTVKNAYGIQYAENMASALLAALPMIIVFLFFQRQIIKGVATTGFGGE